MATVIGDRDVLLLGSSQRALNPLNAGIILTTTAPAFKVDTSGNPLPSTITIKASLIGIAGFVTFTATGATVTDNHDNTATLAYSAVTGNSCTITASITVNGQAFTANVTLAKVADGAAGSSGATGNQYATVYLYQWNSSTPANPTGTSGYTWATGVNSTYSASDGWSVTVPSNPGTPSLKLYVAAVSITAAGGTASTVVSYGTASVQAWAQNGNTGPTGSNGTNGVSGIQSATVMVYQWAASIPSAPAGTTTYTWNGGALGSIPSGWTDTPGTAPSQGITLWAAKVYVTDSATNTQTTINWTSSAIIAVGFSGSNGAAGQSGASYVTAYCASSTGNATSAPAQTTGKTSLPATNSAGITGSWSSTVPTLTAGQYLYQTDGIYDPTTNLVTWSTPYWSSLKVGSLSAITVNTGDLTVSGTISDAGGNWSLDSNGNMTANNATLKGNIKGGDFTSYNWPTVSGKKGFYLGPEGFMIGSLVDNKYFNADQYGNVWTPQFTSVNGAATFSGTLAAGTVMSQNLSSLSATIGTLRTATSGARIEISDNLITGYRSNNTMSFKISA